MFGNGKTYFADSPVVIDISGLAWPATSPFCIVNVEVVYNIPPLTQEGATENKTVGKFRTDTGGSSEISLDISSALRAIWSDYDYDGNEVAKAQTAITANQAQQHNRGMREYSLRITTEYIAEDGVLTKTTCQDGDGNTLIPGGQCLVGGLTEWERSIVVDKADADVSYLEHSNLRNGDASTKPVSSPERVGRDSITSWVDIMQGYTKSVFYPKTTAGGTSDTTEPHAPLVLRDSQPYTDFLFVNSRGAVETCSALMDESMNIDVSTQEYSRVERPSFQPRRPLMAIASGGRRSWGMSSGYQTRDWAEWWTLEFLMAKQWWMLYKGRYVPVIVEASKKSIDIYDKTKQQMPHVDFTVTLALEG